MTDRVRTSASRRRGSVRARGQSWEIRAYAGRDPATGKERTLTRTVHGTQRDAEKALTKLLGEIDAGKHSGPDSTVDQLIDAWWAHNLPRWSPNTAAGYATKLRLYLRPGLGHLKVADITPEHLDRLYGALAAQQLSPGTIGLCHAMLSGMFTLARRWRWIDRNPCEDADPPAVTVNERQPPGPELVRSIIERTLATNPDLAVYLRLAAVTGARRGELCGLRWSDLNGHLLTIDGAVIRRQGGGTERRSTKTNTVRHIPLDPVTVDLLEQQRKRAWMAAVTCGVRLDDGYMFAMDPQGRESWRPDGATSRWNTIRKHLPDASEVRLKDLRSYVATQLSDARTPLPNTARRLGHSGNGQTTLKHYTHPVSESDVAAAELLGQLLDG